ncbi:hypothetical protein QBC44DRAFT_369941 [Cladorrhinum sp. PSN332]|nr:hypothetical protein QBC44DRAFT_369941 [Cladorrhinum sp. PSN332]
MGGGPNGGCPTYIDLYRLLGPNSSCNESLLAAINEAAGSQTLFATLLHLNPDKQGANATSDLDPQTQESTSDAGEILDSVTTYIDCLMDLSDSLQNPVQDLLNGQLSALEPERFEVRPDADRYCRRIRDQYPLLPKYLVEHLGILNAERYFRLRSLDEDALEVIDSNSISTYGTTQSTINNGKARIPLTPNEAHGGQPFTCTVCYASVSGITTRSQWKKHVFSDLQPYCCILEDCDCIIKGAVKIHGSTKDWTQQHEQDHSEKLSDQHCPFCSFSPCWDDRKSYYKHIGQHLQGIALAALPSKSFGNGDENRGSSDESEDDLEQEQQPNEPSDRPYKGSKTGPNPVVTPGRDTLTQAVLPALSTYSIM